MKRYIVLLISIVLILVCGCKKESAPLPVPLKEDLYSPAIELLSKKESISAKLTIETTIHAGQNKYKKVQSGSLSYLNYCTDESLYVLIGDIQYADYKIAMKEILTKNEHYLCLNEKNFYSPSNTKGKQIPLKLLDPSLYKTKTIIQDQTTQYLQYTQPINSENWALPNDAVFSNSAASVTLNNNGEILQAQYTVQYHRNHVQYEEKYTVTYQAGVTTDVQLPDRSTCISVDDIYAPLYLEQAYGFLQQIICVKGVLTEEINSAASSLHYSQTIALSTAADITTIDTNVTLQDYARGSETGYSQSELFKDGQYSISENNGAYAPKPGMDAAAIQTHCQKLLTKNIPSCSYIEGCSLEQNENQIILTIQTGEALAETICQNSCQTIYQDANFLDSKSSDYEDYSVNYVIAIDIHSGLPLHSALDFTGHHTIENIRYELSTKYTQDYSY